PLRSSLFPYTTLFRSVECISLFYQLFHDFITGICRHAADIPDEFLSVNIEFSSERIMMFNQFDRHSAEAGVKCSIETRRSAADDQRVISFHISFPLYDCNFIYYVLL